MNDCQGMRDMVRYLLKDGPLTTSAIRMTLGSGYYDTRKMLMRMEDDGKLHSARISGTVQWSLPKETHEVKKDKYCGQKAAIRLPRPFRPLTNYNLYALADLAKLTR